jgi:hypothetical protein
MTAKEKANKLVKKYQYRQRGLVVTLGDAKQCALIAVDEILNAITFNMYDEEEYNKVNDFWEEVKTEIEKL